MKIKEHRYTHVIAFSKPRDLRGTYIGWTYPYMLNDRGSVNHSTSASVANAESLPESSPQFIENSSTPGAHSMAWCFLHRFYSQVRL